VIVDDGSSDQTPEILAEFAERYDYIRVIRREDRGKRSVGPGVIDAFEDGLASVDLSKFDYVAKYDGDLEVPPRYFERTMERMEEDPYLGNLSGKLFERRPDGSLFEERTGDENAVGPIKFYRTECFTEIGGFVREVCWDGIDGHICRMNGWIAQSVDDPEMRIIHLRPMGSSYKNIRVGRLRWGRGKYFMGSAWYYVLAAALYRSVEPPYLVGGLCILLGYIRACLAGEPRFEDPEYRRYLRGFERSQLLFGKRRALRWENARVRSEGSAKALCGQG
jgi:glycosyltransferase involved in cell wall biosynthesis